MPLYTLRNDTYQITLLQLHKLIDAHVFSYVVVVCKYAFAVYRALHYVRAVSSVTGHIEGLNMPLWCTLLPLWRVCRWDVFGRAF
jgi:hypothetical protein